MSLAHELADLMTQTVTLEPFLASDSHGEHAYGPGVAYQARVRQGAKLIRNAAGEQVVSMTHVTLVEAPALSAKDRLTLPDGRQPPILSISRSPDETGAEIVTVDA